MSQTSGGKVDFFAADIHLSPLHPRRSERFFAFLRLVAREGRALYLLGDIFDLWLGDDIGGGFGAQVRGKLREIADGGVKVYLQHGNRDFLLGRQFAAAAGCELIGDNHIINGGILLTHGDKLDADLTYAIYRAIVRSALARGLFGLLSSARRKNIAAKLRTASDAKRRRPLLKPAMAERLLKRHNCQMLIHGHLHNPCDQQWQTDGKTYRRLCLPAWEGGGEGYARVFCHDGGGEVIADMIVR
ncbi:MAG: UDP-2,3-diacylglucosamine diphosphatase [Gammaproteobacteria bacterium]